MLAFGPDGYLYIGVGDGGSGGDPKGHGLNTQTLLGNLLRIDVHPSNTNDPYAIPADNPFINDACCKPEIYSYGWRNPYRFSFDRITGDLWVPDVGQNEIEEINIVVSGGNYGWNAYEGTQRYAKGVVIESDDLQQPVFEYDHSEGRSITGGYVYRGKAIPSLAGQYIYGDYASGKIWALALDAQGSTTNTLIGNVRNPAGFGETADGELVIVSHNNGLFKFENTQP
jgi:glucose/arabinose dehydrogenase